MGLLFMGHGAQKLFGLFGGHGLAGTAGFFEQGLGLKPGKVHATGAGAAEFFGGLLLALGLFTPFAAAALIGTMAVAIATVHWTKGVWSTEGGYEYNVVLLAAVAAVTERESGAGWALAGLLAGAAGSVAMTELAKRQAEPEPEPQARAQEEPAWSPGDFDRERAALTS